MVNKQIIEYISQQQRQGLTQDEISRNLQNAGWQSDDIAAAIKIASTSAESAPHPSIPTGLNTTPNTSTAPQADHVISNDIYPVTLLRGFKFFIIFIGINLAMLPFGYYFPQLLIAAPLFLIHDLLARKRFKYQIAADGVYLFDGKSYETAKESNRRFMSFTEIESANTNQDWFDTVFGLSKVVYRRRLTDKDEKPSSFRLTMTPADKYNCPGQIGTFLPAMKCQSYRIPGLHKEHAITVANIINTRAGTNETIIGSQTTQ
jgi:hypothetical protein